MNPWTWFIRHLDLALGQPCSRGACRAASFTNVARIGGIWGETMEPRVMLAFTPDLVVVSTDVVVAASPGDTLTYTIGVSNVGLRGATGVVATDVIPANTTFVNASGGGTESGGVVTWAIGSLGILGSVTRTLTVTVNNVASAGAAILLNTASATDDGTHGADAIPLDNTSVDADVLLAQPDLKVTKSDALTTVSPGDTMTYTLTVTNNGNQDATGVLLTDVIPLDSDFVSASAGGNLLLGIVTWNIGALAGGGGTVTQTLTLKLHETCLSGIIEFCNTAAVADDLSNGVDPNLLDNIDCDCDDVVAQPDLQAAVTDGTLAANSGDTLTYTVTVNNNGNQEATGLTLTDTLPGGTTFVSASGGGAELAGVVTWTAASLAAGASLSRTLTVTVNPAGPGSLVNTVDVADDGTNGADPTPEDNTASDTDSLNSAPAALPSPSALIARTSEPATSGNNVAVGEVVRYRLLIEVPPDTYRDMTIHGYLPTGIEYLGNAKIAFWTTNDGDMTSSTLSGPGLDVTTTTPLVDVVPTFGITGAEQTPSSPGFTDGEDVVFSLGDVTNTATNPSPEYIVLEFNALALNDALSSHNATFGVTAVGAAAVSNVLTTTLIEPMLELHNTAVVNGSGTYGDSGDPVVYTYTVLHGSMTGADAYDVNVTSDYSGGIVGPALTSAAIYNSITHAYTDVTSRFAVVGTSLTTTGDVDLLTSDTLTIKVSGTLGAVTPGVNVSNVANITWTGLNGPNGNAGNATGSDTPGASGAFNGERDGSGGVNDYTDSDTATITTPAVDFSNVSINFTPRAFIPGEMAYASVSYANTGASAGGPHTVRLYRSYDGMTPERLLDHANVGALNPGGRTVTMGWQASLADSYADGSNDGTASSYLLAIVDEDNAIPELSETNNTGVLATAGYTVTVPMVSIRPEGPGGSDLSAVEGDRNSGRFVLERTGNLSAPLSVGVSFSGTTDAADFAGALFPTQVVAFQPNQLTAAINISPITDVNTTASESLGETLVATVTPDPGAPVAYTVGGTAQTMMVQDLLPVASLSVTDPNASETGPFSGAFRLTRSYGASAGEPVTVRVDFSGTATPGTDYLIQVDGANMAFSGTFIDFTIPGNKHYLDFKMVPIDDAIAEGDESVVATIVSETTPMKTYSIGTDTQSIDIIDNDGPNLRAIITASPQKLVAPTSKGPNKIPTMKLTFTNTASADSVPTTYQVCLIADPGRPLTIADFENSTYRFPIMKLSVIRARKSVNVTSRIRLSNLPELPAGVYFAAVKADAGNAMAESNEADNYGFSAARFTIA
jgi:uncharacterized repeat protein (TIGR01451 family)